MPLASNLFVFVQIHPWLIFWDEDVYLCWNDFQECTKEHVCRNISKPGRKLANGLWPAAIASSSLFVLSLLYLRNILTTNKICGDGISRSTNPIHHMQDIYHHYKSPSHATCANTTYSTHDSTHRPTYSIELNGSDHRPTYCREVQSDHGPTYSCEVIDSGPTYGCEVNDLAPTYSFEVNDSGPTYSCEVNDSGPTYSCEVIDSGPTYSCEVNDSGPTYSSEVQEVYDD